MFAAVWLSSGACGDEVSVTTKCVAGGKLDCVCDGGGFGQQVCGDNEQFGPCVCEAYSTTGTTTFTSSTTGSGGAGGSGSMFDGAGGAAVDSGVDAGDASVGAKGALLSSGASPLVLRAPSSYRDHSRGARIQV